MTTSSDPTETAAIGGDTPRRTGWTAFDRNDPTTWPPEDEVVLFRTFGGVSHSYELFVRQGDWLYTMDSYSSEIAKQHPGYLVAWHPIPQGCPA